MSKMMVLLTAGVLAAGLTSIVMAGQWGQAPKQVYPVHATPEMTQPSRDEHDLIAEMIKAQLAAERGRLPKQRVAGSATPIVSGTTTARRRADRTLSSSHGGRNG
jgi:hypothetical protein